MGKTQKTKAGDRVRVEGELDTYRVTGKDRSMVLLRNERTGEEARVYYKKVALAPEGADADDSREGETLADLLAEEHADQLAREKPKGPGKPPKVNPNDLLAAGHEVWTRRLAFDHDHVTAEAWYVFAADGQRAWSFNTYDRSLGKRQKPTTVREHALADEADRERRTKRLVRRGYHQLGEGQ